MNTLGILTFQANDASDVFLKIVVQDIDEDLSDESLIGAADAQFDSNLPWVTGNVPKFQRVTVKGDTVLINAWFKTIEQDYTLYPLRLNIYLECEMAEELIEVEAEEEVQDVDKKEDLEPNEIHL